MEVGQPERPAQGIIGLVRESLSGSEQDYTTGDLNRSILLLAIPMILEMGMEALFAIVDTFFVSRLGAASIAVVGLTESILGLAASGRLGSGKQMLPQTLPNSLPRSVLDRPKSGFVVPTWRWLRHHAGLEAWKSVPLLKQTRLSDSRRWAYTLLNRHPSGRVLLHT